MFEFIKDLLFTNAYSPDKDIREYLPHNPQEWSYYPYGFGLNISDDALWECPICQSQTPAICQAHWIGKKMVCKRCKDANESLQKLNKVLFNEISP